MQVAIVLVLAVLRFDVPIRGSLLHLGVGALPFLAAILAFLAVALGVATISFRKQLR